MTKVERELLSKKLSTIIKTNRGIWQDLKEEILSFGYEPYYPAQQQFELSINILVNGLEDDSKEILINEWKQHKQRVQFQHDEEYLEQYKLYLMEELVSRANKAAYRS